MSRRVQLVEITERNLIDIETGTLVNCISVSQ